MLHVCYIGIGLICVDEFEQSAKCLIKKIKVFWGAICQSSSRPEHPLAPLERFLNDSHLKKKKKKKKNDILL